MKTSRKIYNRNNVIIMFKVQEGGKCSSAPTYLESSEDLYKGAMECMKSNNKTRGNCYDVVMQNLTYTEI